MPNPKKEVQRDPAPAPLYNTSLPLRRYTIPACPCAAIQLPLLTQAQARREAFPRLVLGSIRSERLRAATEELTPSAPAFLERSVPSMNNKYN